MPSLQQYVLEPVTTGGYDEGTIADILTALEAVLSSLGDPHKVPDTVAVELRKIKERLGGEAGLTFGVAGKNFLFYISRVRGPEGTCSRFWSVNSKDDVEKGNLGDWNLEFLPNTVMIVMAKIQGVRSLQDLAAYQVACSHGTNLERLLIPKKIKEVVSKFN
eukprot:GFUD01059757.1.p1 GENE.GFUD01059757.1~~GFUD01059757.1.p1  ORF type:complete len:162 (-),score=36.06 GFUD01059757.1:20-505(-)